MVNGISWGGRALRFQVREASRRTRPQASSVSRWICWTVSITIGSSGISGGISSERTDNGFTEVREMVEQ